MRKLVESIQNNLVAKGKTLSTAESCTGGILAMELTSLPGSSAIYLGGVASYSNKSKEIFLGVPPETLTCFGAVSAQTAEAMALGVRRQLQSDFALSLTGIAGPEGGTAEKPVGTVWCGIASPNGVRSVHLDLSEVLKEKVDKPSMRERIRHAAALSALSLLLEEIGDN